MNTLKQLFFPVKNLFPAFLLLICLNTASILEAQVTKSISITYDVPTSKSVNCTAGGQLSTLLSSIEKTYVENLTITGTIDARDFKTMRDDMPALSVINLTGSSIAAYTGTDGPLSPSGHSYPANEFPWYSFYSNSTGYGKTTLTSISMPSSINSIGRYAFGYCSSISLLSIPSSVTNIQNWAFTDCGNNLSITIPAATTTVGNWAFEGFNGSINVHSSNTIYSSANGVLFDFDKSKLIQCPASMAGSYTIPSTVDTIGWNAFSRCTHLTGSFVIPPSVKYIGDWAFRNCTGITGPMVIPASVTSIGDGTFNWMTGLTSIHVYNPVPVDLTTKSSVFDGISKDDCALYVLTGVVEDYNSAAKWTDFNNIYGVYKYLANNGNPVSGAVCWPAFDSIIVAKTAPVTLLSGSTVNAIAGKLIRFMPGFNAQSGCYLHAYITTNGAFCDGVGSSSPVVLPEEKSVTEQQTPDVNKTIEKSIKVYPNPNNGQFTLEFSNLEVKAEVKVFNALGVTIYKSVIWQKQQKIDLAGIQRGLYFVKVIDGKEQFISKFMVN